MAPGAGSKIRDRVQSVTDSQLNLLARSLPSENYASIEDSQPMRQQSSLGTRYHPQQDCAIDQTVSANTYAPNPAQSHAQTSYPATTQYNSFPEVARAPNLTYTPSSNYATYSSSSQNEVTRPPLVPVFQATQPHGGMPQASPTTQFHQTPNNPANMAWQQYASTMVGDCYSDSASALMQLQGGRDINNEGRHQGDMTGVSTISNSHMGGMVADSMSNQWPMIVFPNDQVQKFE